MLSAEDFVLDDSIPQRRRTSSNRRAADACPESEARCMILGGRSFTSDTKASENTGVLTPEDRMRYTTNLQFTTRVCCLFEQLD